MREKKYLIPLRPIPWKRAGLAGTKFYDQQVNDKIAFGLYLNKEHGSEPKFEGSIAIDIIFYMPTSQSKRDKKDYLYHKSTPDLDNLVKLLLDAIVSTNSIITDDRIISVISAKKIYDPKPRTEFTIRELE